MPTPLRRPLRALLVALALLVTAAGCRGFLGRGTSGTPPLVVSFANESRDMATVYAVGRSGERFRIGNVASGRTERLRIPASIYASGTVIYFVVRPQATSRFIQSGAVSIQPGEKLLITLPPAANALLVLPGQ